MVFALTVQLAATAVLIFAAGPKIFDAEPLEFSLSELGVTKRVGRLAAVAFPYFELLCALLIAGVLTIRQVPGLLLAVLGIGLLGVAVYVAVSGKDASCACFGSTSEARLGTRQVFVGLPTLCFGAFVFFAGPATASAADGLAVVGASAILASAAHATFGYIKAMRETMALRRIFQTTLAV